MPVRQELVRRADPEIRRAEQLVKLGRRELAALGVGDRLHLLREVDLEPARQVEPVLAREQVRDAALPRLGVDPDDRLVVAADVLRVDRQVRHVPHLRRGALLRVHSLLDGVLVRARERRVHELSHPGMPRMHR